MDVVIFPAVEDMEEAQAYRKESRERYNSLTEEQQSQFFHQILGSRGSSTSWAREWLSCEVSAIKTGQRVQFSQKMLERWRDIFDVIEFNFPKARVIRDRCVFDTHFALGMVVVAPVEIEGRDPYFLNCPFAMMDWSQSEITEYIQRTYDWLWE